MEDKAPQIKYFTPQAFIKPIQDKIEYLTGTYNSYNFNNYKVKIRELFVTLSDYKIATKQLKINRYIPNYDNIKEHQETEINFKYLVIFVIGEIAYRKHIKKLNFKPFASDY